MTVAVTLCQDDERQFFNGGATPTSHGRPHLNLEREFGGFCHKYSRPIPATLTPDDLLRKYPTQRTITTCNPPHLRSRYYFNTWRHHIYSLQNYKKRDNKAPRDMCTIYFYICQGRCKITLPGELRDCEVKGCKVFYSKYLFFCRVCPGVPDPPSYCGKCKARSLLVCDASRFAWVGSGALGLMRMAFFTLWGN